MRFPGNIGEKKDMGEAGILLTDEFGFPMDPGGGAAAAATDNIPKMHSLESKKSQSQNESDVASCGSWVTRLVDLYVKDKSVFRRVYGSIACAYVAVVAYLCVAQGLTLRFTISPMALSPCGIHPFEYASSIAAFVTVYLMGGFASIMIFKNAHNNEFVLTDFKLTYVMTLVLAILYIVFQLVPNLQARWPDSNWILVLILGSSHIVSVILPIWASFAEERRTNRLMLELTLSSLHQVYDEPVMYQDLKKFAIQDMSGENFFFLESLDALKHQSRIHLLRAQEAETKKSQPRSSIFHSIHKISTSRSNSVSIGSHERNSSSGVESAFPGNLTSLRVSTMAKPQQYPMPNSSSFSISDLLHSFSLASSPTGTAKSEHDQNKSVKRRLLQHDAVQIDSETASSVSIDSVPRSSGVSNVPTIRAQKKSLLRNVLRDSIGSQISSHGSQESMAQMKGETISAFAIPPHHRRKSPAVATASYCGVETKDSSRSLHLETTSAVSFGGSDTSDKVIICSPTSFADLICKPSHLVPTNQALQNNSTSSSSSPQNVSASLAEIPVSRKTDDVDSPLNLTSTSKDAKTRFSLKSIINDSSFNIAANQRKSQASLGIELKRSSQASTSQTSIRKQLSLANRKSAFSLGPEPNKQSQASLEQNSQSSLGKRKSFGAEVGRNSRTKGRRLLPEEEAALDLKPVPKSLIADYNHVFELYCGESAMFAVNLSAGTRGRLKEVFKSQNWTVGDFSKAREEVFSNIVSAMCKE
ncbi:hypothetical protein HDU81_008066 [Chytriomyces hyalinus]|nr:hypothetical protein HDU81_008066 [Chytriomyces hyalinus]